MATAKFDARIVRKTCDELLAAIDRNIDEAIKGKIESLLRYPEHRGVWPLRRLHYRTSAEADAWMDKQHQSFWYTPRGEISHMFSRQSSATKKLRDLAIAALGVGGDGFVTMDDEEARIINLGEEAA